MPLALLRAAVQVAHEPSQSVCLHMHPYPPNPNLICTIIQPQKALSEKACPHMSQTPGGASMHYMQEQMR